MKQAGLRVLSFTIIAIIIASIIVSGCSSSRSSSTADTTATGSDSSSGVPQMPDFFLEQLTGGTLSRDDLLGTPIVLNFEASWCGPCEYEAPTFKKVSESRNDVRFVAIAVKDSQEAQQQFVDKYGWTFTVAMDFTGRVVTDFQKEALMPRGAIPTTFFIDSRGNIIDVYLGPISEQDLNSQIAALLEVDAANQAKTESPAGTTATAAS